MNPKNKKGIDIGDHNGNFDLAQAKAQGYEFVMIKVGYGSDFKSQDDSQFEANVRKAEELGMPWGAWIYSYATNATEAKSEAYHMLRMTKGKKPTMPIAIDMEDADNYKYNHGALNRDTVSTVCKVFIEEIRKAGYYPMLYTGYSMKPFLTNEVLNMADLWWAQWSSKLDYTADNVGLWQYGGETNYIDSPYIDGIRGAIDKDMCYKDYPSIIKNGNYNGWSGGSGGGSGTGGKEVYCNISMPYLAKSGYISTGEEVKTVQLLLNAMHYGDLEVDGIFGDATDEAVKKFQKSRKLDQDGIVGADTWRYLLK